MIDTKVHIGPVLRGLENIKRFNGRRVFRDARKPVRADLRDHAKTQQGPDGRWQGLAASTKERRARGGRKRRRKLLGRLPGAFKITSGPLFVRATSLVAWSMAHKKGRRVGHGARLPRRDFAWMSRKLITNVRDMLNAALSFAWAGR